MILILQKALTAIKNCAWQRYYVICCLKKKCKKQKLS